MNERILSRLGIAWALLAVAGCASHGLVQTSPDSYLLRKEAYSGPYAPDRSGLQDEVRAEAERFARERGKAAVPVSGDEHVTGMFRNYVSYEYQFRLVDQVPPEPR